LSDVIADNTSASGFVLGGWARPDQPIGNLGMILEIDGVERQIGSSAAIMGNPIRSLVAAAMVSHKAGEPLQPGDVVLAGGATAAEPLQRGQHVRVTVQRLGSAEFFVR
jgi:2-oxo-3-hexenedioate decarboxylase